MMKISCNDFFLHSHGKCGMIQLMPGESKLSMPKGCLFPPPPPTPSVPEVTTLITWGQPQGKDMRGMLDSPTKKSLTSQII